MSVEALHARHPCDAGATPYAEWQASPAAWTAGNEIERVYFPQSGMVSLVVVMQSDAAVETATIGRAGIIGASAGLGLKQSFARAIVQLPGTAAWLSASQFHAATNGSPAIRDLLVHYSGLLLGQVQQSVACSCECYVIVRGYTDKIFPPSEGA